ncbi:MAG: hypothetical protein IJ370_05320 [Oscillospiraceae bacterium]|nr:hypothetical protein [Oscillospiraceae bacterium]
MKQKILAIFLSVVMLLGMLPASIIAGAADGEAAESTLPAGTVGYVMDVPETEQYIKYKVNGITCFGWTSRFFMQDTANNAADPFNAKDYGSPNSNYGAYVRNLDGEYFLVLNPQENTVDDYASSTETVTTTTTDETTGDVTKYVDKVVNTSTDKTTGNGASGEYSTHNGKLIYNGINSINHPTKITSDGMVGLPLIDSANVDKITHLAFRIKMVGGHKDQISGWHDTEIGLSYKDIYFIDAKTGDIQFNKYSDLIALPSDFDGYMIAPANLEKLKAKGGMFLYTFEEAHEYYSTVSSWIGRSLCLGDIYAVSDIDAFKESTKPVTVPAPDDSAKDIFTVPEAGGKISHNNAYDTFSTKDYNFGIQRYYNETDSWKGSSISVTENGENFFPFTIPTAYAGTAVKRGMSLLPASYMTNIPFYVYDEEGNIQKSESGSNLYNNGNALSTLVDYEGADLYGEDLTQYGHIAIRFKAKGGVEGQTSPLGLNIGANGEKTISDVTLVNYTDGSITKVTSGSVLNIAYNFNGWIIVGSGNFSASISDIARICFIPEILSETNNWTNKTMCIGDIKVVKNLDTFLKGNGFPVFTVAVSETDTSKVVITNDADTDNEVTYSVDGKTWLSAEELGNVALATGNHTISAKYPWSSDVEVSKVSISTPPFNYKGVEGASYFMDLYDDIAAHPYLGYATLTYTNKELGWPSGAGTVCKGADGAYNGDSGSARLYLVEFDGETFIEFDKNPAQGEANQNVYHNAINFNTTDHKSDGGFPAGVNTTELRSVAIRVKITEDTELEDVVSIFGLKVQGGSNASLETNLSDAYLVDIANKQIIDPEWTGSGFKFNSAFDGWIIAPFEAWGTNGKTAFTTSTNIQYWLHGSSCDHGHKSSNWDNRILYIGDIIGLEDEEAFVCEYIGAHNVEKVEWTAPSAANTGFAAHYACSCGKTYADADGKTEMNPALLTFDAASLTLEQNIAVNFKANVENLDGLTDVYAKFTFNGVEKIVEIEEAVEGKYVFTFDGIGPQLLGKTIKAQLFGTYNGTEYSGTEIEYSVKDYCYNKLAEYEYTEGDKAQAFRTLLVDLLNYGAKAQIHTNTDKYNLVTDGIGYILDVNRTVAAADITTGTKGIYDDLADENTLATWKGVNLYFEETVGMMFRFATDSLDGVTVKVTDTEGNLIEEIENFTSSDKGGYIAYFDGLNANEMRKTVHVAVYKNGEKVSDTLAYDVVSYAKEIITRSYVSERVKYVNEVKKGTSWPGDPYKTLKVLVSFMMRYGDAVANYVAVNA